MSFKVDEQRKQILSVLNCAGKVEQCKDSGNCWVLHQRNLILNPDIATIGILFLEVLETKTKDL